MRMWLVMFRFTHCKDDDDDYTNIRYASNVGDIIINIVIIKCIYIAQNRVMQLMHWIDSHTANKNVLSLCLNVSTEMSGAGRSAGRINIDIDVCWRRTLYITLQSRRTSWSVQEQSTSVNLASQWWCPVLPTANRVRLSPGKRSCTQMSSFCQKCAAVIATVSFELLSTSLYGLRITLFAVH